MNFVLLNPACILQLHPRRTLDGSFTIAICRFRLFASLEYAMIHLPHASEGILDLDLANDGVALALDLLQQLSLLRDDRLQGLLEIRLSRARVGTGKGNCVDRFAGSLVHALARNPQHGDQQTAYQPAPGSPWGQSHSHCLICNVEHRTTGTGLQ